MILPAARLPVGLPLSFLQPAHWRHYWPLWLGALAVVWLTVTLLFRSPTEWVVAAGARQPHATTSPVQQTATAINPTDESTDALVSTWLYPALVLGLPYALLLLAVGYYLYWQFARKTIFSGSVGGQFSFWLATLLLWGLWKLSVTGGAQISGATARAGVDQLLPTLTVNFWLVQLAVMHVVARQREDRQLVQAAREAELAALTAQVNPPFIFHALRHLQAAAQTEHLPRAEQSLAQLAGIMQYVLEESRKQWTDVSREIDFIRDYLRLQQLRLPTRDTIQISTEVDWDGAPVAIVPLLLNPLIENAFKYGISMQQVCFVTIRLHVANGLLTFTAENSVLPRTDLEKGTGLGLANVRKRLRLAYPDRHKLTVTATPDQYRVDLKIQL